MLVLQRSGRGGPSNSPTTKNFGAGAMDVGVGDGDRIVLDRHDRDMSVCGSDVVPESQGVCERAAVVSSPG